MNNDNFSHRLESMRDESLSVLMDPDYEELKSFALASIKACIKALDLFRSGSWTNFETTLMLLNEAKQHYDLCYKKTKRLYQDKELWRKQPTMRA